MSLDEAALPPGNIVPRSVNGHNARRSGLVVPANSNCGGRIFAHAQLHEFLNSATEHRPLRLLINHWKAKAYPWRQPKCAQSKRSHERSCGDSYTDCRASGEARGIILLWSNYLKARCGPRAARGNSAPHRRSTPWCVFLPLLAGAVGWPLGAIAQSPTLPVIGFLNTAWPAPFEPLVAAFHEGLKDGGYIEGKNVAIEYRWAKGEYDRLPELAADLVRRRATVIVATGGTVAARAAKAATTTIPVLFIGGANPVGEGLVSSFNRPGGNVTGVSTYTSEMAPKRLELLRRLMPKATKIAMLINPENPADNRSMQDVEAAIRVAGLTLLIAKAKDETEFEQAFGTTVQQAAQALFVSADPIFNSRRGQIVALAARHAVPAVYPWREYVIAGGLMSYGPSISGLYRQIGQYATRILKGDKPGDLPVQNPAKFELLINVKTARALDLSVPSTLTAIADEVIE